MLNNRNNNKNH